jgi:hypothetical protein
MRNLRKIGLTRLTGGCFAKYDDKKRNAVIDTIFKNFALDEKLNPKGPAP